MGKNKFSNSNEGTLSIWNDTIAPINYSKLDKDIEADVVVVGGGIAGVTIAYLLSRGKKNVVLIDDGAIGSGETGRTTAHITYALDDRFYKLKDLFDIETLVRAGESHWEALNFIEGLIMEESIDCDFKRVDGYMFLTPGDEDTDLKKEFETANEAGLIDVEYLDISPFENFPGPCLKFLRQGRFHPLKYLRSLCERIVQHGGKIYTQTHASDITSEVVTTSEKYNIKAGSIVVTTNTPVNDKLVIHTKQAPYRTYVIGASVPRGSVPDVLLWDTKYKTVDGEEAYHYVRLCPSQGLHEENDIILIGGEDHKTGQGSEEGRFERLEEWGRKYYNIIDIKYKWSGQVMEPVDGMAYIGRNPLDADNVYVATGDSGNGITHGTIAGFIISDMILGKDNKFGKIYDPSRKTVSAVPDLLEEGINVVKQYKDWVTPGDIDSVEKLSNGEGAVMRHGLLKLAVYRENDGEISYFNAECPHMGCIVQWNGTEKSFDCPCHGSRFNTKGDVLNGPAINGLAPYPMSK